MLVFSLGCSSDPSAPATSDAGGDTATVTDARSRDCSITVTGAHMGNDVCRDLTLTYDVRSSKTSFGIGNSATDPALVVLANVTVTGEEPSPKTFDSTMADVTCSVMVKQGAKAWQAQTSTSASKGSCTLTFSEVSVDAATATVKAYRYKGTLQAHVVANDLTGATGEADVSATFQY